MKRIVSLLVMLTAVLALSACNMPFMSSENELDLETKTVKLVKEVQRGDYDVVTTAELKKWIDEGRSMLIVDTMPYEASYKKNHIPGAAQFLFPIPDMNEWDMKETGDKSQAEFEAMLGPDKDRVLVFYCGFVKCTRSHNGAAWARKLGYTNVYRHPGGIRAWIEAGYPVDSIK
ncbi:Rhodanese-like protein [Oleidesulfovibrio alaskensis G20]|jgi:rhodanese-related sulfurtransferase|uniref:Rhodanese-like protein n=1 Tax=Oleidesulfovibrio alaskensis (strain ATCC BAA-1058 / DSM 17464 / G20) TaxID=207559 RepID=Q314N9_OLEA2|nr:rhodanese-like domain-containing protein [Oleidesulfovibrio alaskensis]ABB37607.1 Rhodanese-like protein [Oleidesulfovibrio alaskensis G20]MBG0773528.1 rhodanese-like domain-containing protein [Oleidesulfovibrio alaskensis]MBL3581328.1 rhodanese-like domain-containing protein [Oleidesulfovibrio alaskensis]